MSVASLAIKFTAIDQLSQVVGRVKSRLASLAAGGEEVQAAFDRMNKSFKWAAISAVGTRTLAKSLKPALDAAGNLQSEMLGARAEMAGAAKNAKELEKNLTKIKSTAFTIQAWTPFNQAQIVALEKQLLKSGAAVSDVIGKQGAAAASAALAVYENMDAAKTGKGLIGIATPFGIKASEFMELADMVSRTASAAPVGAAEIVETAKYAAPAMAKLKRPIKEMFTLSAMLAKSGVDASMAGTALREFFTEAAKTKTFRDAHGNLKDLAEITNILQENLKGLGEAKQLEILDKIFGRRGSQVAFALMSEGEGSYENINDAMKGSLSLQQKLRIRMRGFFKQLESLSGTSTSVLAELFQPALKWLTPVVKKTNEWMTALGEIAQKNKSLSAAVSGASLGGVAAGTAATIGLTAAGQAVEAVTGVQPVFVTNWPAGGVGGGGETPGTVLAGEASRRTAGGLLRWVGNSPSFLPAAWLGRLASMGSLGATLAGSAATAGTGTVLATAGAGLAIGYGLGSLIDRWIGITDKLANLIAGTPALVGVPEHMKSRLVENKINLNIQIDQERGRVTTKTNDMNTRVNVKPIPRGALWHAKKPS